MLPNHWSRFDVYILLTKCYMKSGSKYFDFGHILGGICFCTHSLVNLDFFHKLLYFGPKNNFLPDVWNLGCETWGRKKMSNWQAQNHLNPARLSYV